jgi:class 3 adenylate cyclase
VTDGLTEQELAERAGVDPEVVRRYDALGFLRAGEGGYASSDLARIRLILACERAGLPLDGIAQAVERGLMSFAFLDQPQYGFAAVSETTFAELCGQVGLAFETVRRLHEALGLPAPASADQGVREDEFPLLRAVGLARAFGMPEDAIVRAARVYGDGMRRIAEAENHVYRTYVERPLLDAGMSVGQMLEGSSEFGQEYLGVMDAAFLGMYHRQQESVWLGNMVANLEDALEEMGVHRRLDRPPAMVFLDLTGYTRLTEERGDEAAAELAANLARIAQGTSQHHGGRAVKWLGDGVMFHFPDPSESVVAALELVDRTPRAELPPAHVGVAAGPVVLQDGDFFGRTVNMAARISARAAPSEVLVNEEVAHVAANDAVRFEETGAAELKGFANPVPLLRASWA